MCDLSLFGVLHVFIVTQSPLRSAGGKMWQISQVFLGADLWSTSGLVFRCFQLEVETASCVVSSAFPPAPSTLSNYTADRYHMVLTYWSCPSQLIFLPVVLEHGVQDLQC